MQHPWHAKAPCTGPDSHKNLTHPLYMCKSPTPLSGARCERGKGMLHTMLLGNPTCFIEVDEVGHLPCCLAFAVRAAGVRGKGPRAHSHTLGSCHATLRLLVAACALQMRRQGPLLPGLRAAHPSRQKQQHSITTKQNGRLPLLKQSLPKDWSIKLSSFSAPEHSTNGHPCLHLTTHLTTPTSVLVHEAHRHQIIETPMQAFVRRHTSPPHPCSCLRRTGTRASSAYIRFARRHTSAMT
eukprot:1146914-Pelagomonas_calceolata.AAC.23